MYVNGRAALVFKKTPYIQWHLHIRTNHNCFICTQLTIKKKIHNAVEFSKCFCGPQPRLTRSLSDGVLGSGDHSSHSSVRSLASGLCRMAPKTTQFLHIFVTQRPFLTHPPTGGCASRTTYALCLQSTFFPPLLFASSSYG
jgi:hypothetical protein